MPMERSMPYLDGTLEARLLAGDAEAIGRVSRWVADVLTLPRYWSLSREWKDLHQEALMRVLESLRAGRYDASRDLRVYVQGVVRHTALQRLNELRSRPDARQSGHAPAPDAEHGAMMRQLVRRVFDLASDECRDLIRGYFLRQLSYAEIAQELEIPIGTVKSRLFRCLESAYQAIARTREGRPRPARKT